MNKRTRKLTTACFALTAAFSFMLMPIGVSAYDDLPSNIGTKTSEITVSGKDYINYQRGYVELSGGETVKTRGGYVMTAGGESKIAVNSMLSMLAYNNDGSITRVLGYAPTEVELDAIQDKFEKKYTELYDSGFVAGLSLGDIEGWDNVVIKQEFRYGDSTANPDDGNGGKKNNSILAYNVAQNEVYAITDGYVNAYDEAHRILGAPLADAGKYDLTGETVKGFKPNGVVNCQPFETGVIVEENGVYTAYSCGIYQINGAYMLMPIVEDQDLMERTNRGYSFIGDLDGEWHPLKTAEIVYDEDNDEYNLYANYYAGAVKLVYTSDYTLLSEMRYAGKNFFGADRELEILHSSCYDRNEFYFEGESVGTEIEPEALAYYRNYQPNATGDSLKQLFKDCYADLVENDNFMPGYRSSAIKMWDLLVLDFKFGDGTTGFDATGTGKRERMTTMVYSPLKNKVFAVHSQYFNIFKQDSGTGRVTLGYPISKILRDAVIGGVTYSEIQIFEKGYIYKNLAGDFNVEIGYLYNETENKFETTPAPTVSEKYGFLKNTRIKDGIVYLDYEYGAVACRLNANGLRYLFDYYPGRNFDDNFTAHLLPMENFISADKLTSSGAMPLDKNGNEIDFDTVIKPMIIARYKKIYDSGFFPGFLEESFKGTWNNVHAQQLIVGDSTANPFGSSRPNVSAIVFDGASNDTYFLANDNIRVWQTWYGTAKAPTSDEYQIAGYDYYFQTFTFGMIIRRGNNAFFTESYESAQDYIDKLPKLTIPTHNKKNNKGYIG